MEAEQSSYRRPTCQENRGPVSGSDFPKAAQHWGKIKFGTFSAFFPTLSLPGRTLCEECPAPGTPPKKRSPCHRTDTFHRPMTHTAPPRHCSCEAAHPEPAQHRRPWRGARVVREGKPRTERAVQPQDWRQKPAWSGQEPGLSSRQAGESKPRQLGRGRAPPPRSEVTPTLHQSILLSSLPLS